MTSKLVGSTKVMPVHVRWEHYAEESILVVNGSQQIIAKVRERIGGGWSWNAQSFISGSAAARSTTHAGAVLAVETFLGIGGAK